MSDTANPSLLALFAESTGVARHTHNHNITITERRAPTDESVRLLAEFEQRAQDRVTSVSSLEGNELSCRWWTELHDCGLRRVARVRYKLNGKGRELLIDLPNDERLWNCHEEQAREVAAMVHEAVTKDLASHITVQLFLSARTNLKPLGKP